MNNDYAGDHSSSEHIRWRLSSRRVSRVCAQKSNKDSAVIVGLFITALAYLEYPRIIQVDWDKPQAVSQSRITMLANAVIHISNNIGADHI